MKIRLNKFLADAGCCSRRKADELIRDSQVKVNNETKTELGLKVDPEEDEIFLNDKLIKPSEKTFIYYALNKPKGVVSTAAEDKTMKTVVDLVPKIPRVYPVGRLDKNSQGLIVLTNDGELTKELTHPKYEHEKEYQVQVKSREFGAKNLEQIRRKFTNGLLIDGKLMKADKIDIILQTPNSKFLTLFLVLHTGYNRQIRKMCAKIGLEVVDLVRVRLNKLKLSDLGLKMGEYRKIERNQII